MVDVSTIINEESSLKMVYVYSNLSEINALSRQNQMEA